MESSVAAGVADADASAPGEAVLAAAGLPDASAASAESSLSPQPAKAREAAMTRVRGIVVVRTAGSFVA